MSKNKIEEARKVLIKIRDAEEKDHLLHSAETELQEIIQAVEEEKRAVGKNNNFFQILKRVNNIEHECTTCFRNTYYAYNL